MRAVKASVVVIGSAVLIAALSQLPTLSGLDEEEAPDMSKVCFVDNEIPDYSYESQPRPPLTWLDKQSAGIELTPEHGLPKWVEDEIALIPAPGGFLGRGEREGKGVPKCWYKSTSYAQVSEPGTGCLIALAVPIVLLAMRDRG